MDINIEVIGQKMKIRSDQKFLAPQSQKFVRFNFLLDESWKDLLVFAQFTQGESYNVYLDEGDSCYLPPEITTGECTLMLYGTGQENVIGTTTIVRLTVSEEHFVADGQSTEITQSLYTQLVAKTQKQIADATEVLETKINERIKTINNVSADENGNYTLPSASESATGVVKLLTSVESNSTTEAGTPASIKQAYDFARTKANKPTLINHDAWKTSMTTLHEHTSFRISIPANCIFLVNYTELFNHTPATVLAIGDSTVDIKDKTRIHVYSEARLDILDHLTVVYGGFSGNAEKTLYFYSQEQNETSNENEHIITGWYMPI